MLVGSQKKMMAPLRSGGDQRLESVTSAPSWFAIVRSGIAEPTATMCSEWKKSEGLV